MQNGSPGKFQEKKLRFFAYHLEPWVYDLAVLMEPAGDLLFSDNPCLIISGIFIWTMPSIGEVVQAPCRLPRIIVEIGKILYQ